MEHKREEKQKERGQSLLEFALLVPILLIILAGALDLGRLYFTYVAVTDAAAEGATYAAINPPSSDIADPYTCPAYDPSSLVCDPVNDPEDVACTCERAQAAGRGLILADGGQVAIECLSCPDPLSGDPITVTVTYSFTLATPFLNVVVPGGSLPLRAVASEAVLVGALTP